MPTPKISTYYLRNGNACALYMGTPKCELENVSKNQFMNKILFVGFFINCVFASVLVAGDFVYFWSVCYVLLVTLYWQHESCNGKICCCYLLCFDVCCIFFLFVIFSCFLYVLVCCVFLFFFVCSCFCIFLFFCVFFFVVFSC